MPPNFKPLRDAAARNVLRSLANRAGAMVGQLEYPAASPAEVERMTRDLHRQWGLVSKFFPLPEDTTND